MPKLKAEEKIEEVAMPGSITVYIGTYTREGGSEGIYRSSLDLKTGALSKPMLAAKLKSPSFLAIHPSRPLLYAVSETGGDPEEAQALNAFAIDTKTGDLKHLNSRSTGGGGACHVTVDRSGRVVLAANYSGGSIVSAPINEDGSLGEVASFIQHEGSSVHPQRQKAPHAHSIMVSGDSKFAYSADLGVDKILIYKLDAATGKLTKNPEAPFAKMAPGSGPRHFAFHPNKDFAYVNSEMTSSVSAFKRSPETGSLTELQSISTLPKGYKNNNSTAEILVHPSGKFLYCSNRGHDSIAGYAIGEDGLLAPLGQTPIGGKTPRGFNIDPFGKFLVAGGQNSDSIHVFKIDGESGALSSVGEPIEVFKPVSVKFFVHVGK